MFGGLGNDTLYAGDGADYVDGGDGDDDLSDRLAEGASTILGGAGSDRLRLDFSALSGNQTFTLVSNTTFSLANGTEVSGVEYFDITTGAGDDAMTLAPVVGSTHSWHAGDGVDQAVLDFSGWTEDLYSSLGGTAGYYNTYFPGYVRTLDELGVSLHHVEALSLISGSGNDNLSGGDHNDRIEGRGGNDVVDSQAGNDTILGGLGNDTLYAGDGADYVDGGDGDDDLSDRLAEGASTILGGAGSDRLRLDFGALSGNQTFTLVSNTTFSLANGTEVSGIEYFDITTGAGDDAMTLAPVVGSTHSWYAGDGVDQAVLDFSGWTEDLYSFLGETAGYYNTYFPGYVRTLDELGVSLHHVEALSLISGSGNDNLSGGDHNDRIEGRGGNDTINARDGEDYVVGGEGDDVIYAGAGNDTIIGGDGADVVDGAGGSDVIYLTGTSYHTSGYAAFNASSDIQVGTQARITLEGLVRIEVVSDGGADADIVQLSDEGDAFFLHDAYSGFHGSVALTDDYAGNESAARFANIEEIRGVGGDDIIDLTSPDYSLAGIAMSIDGGDGNDVIWGSDANENIVGGNGDDTIFGGIGTDMLTGGAGADVFEFTRTSTNTSVTDFDISAGDTLRFYNTGGAEFDASSVVLTTTGIQISYTDTASGIDHSLSISLAQTGSDFTATLVEIQNALEII
ncbi:MAG: hypothetical protein R3D81_08165 [Thalassovita sp.]